MITPRQIRDLMQARPFQPFRITLSDGSHYDIPHHDAAMVGRNTVEIGLNFDPEGYAELFTRCSILHVTQIEDLPTTPSR